MSSFLSLYEPLDIIGTGSFGVIRKVRRKADGMIFARKELKFERMSERDKKLIVSEVNILKDLHHEHIVRYHDRYVDRDAGIMYILMEYCGNGDLSTVIKQAQRHGRPIPEDTVWNYFMQILLALNYCHHPPVHGRTSAGSTGSGDGEEGKEGRRAQILHRDLKPDNVFLDENHCVKLGDFGLSKALAPASFAQTYVGTPYYMSPELMQEKAYDSKSDIWSLGCLIYELCALKPPFHEAKTHAELSILIRNGRIPPLPKTYSPALTTVIKAMLNLNPAMRPSAAQLLQHERIDLAFKVAEAQKMLNTVKAHKASAASRERELLARETALTTREAELSSALTSKDAELASLRALLASAETTHHQRVREALARREEELRQMVLKQEAEVALRMARREEEIMDAVRRREEEIAGMWREWERETREGMVRAVEERMEWVRERGEEIERERERLEGVRGELGRRVGEVEERERRVEEWERRVSESERESEGKGRYGHGLGGKAPLPLEEVQNVLVQPPPPPVLKLEDANQDTREHTPIKPFTLTRAPPSFSTPIQQRLLPPGPSSPSTSVSSCASAMKGVVLTQTGEAIPTPSRHPHQHSSEVVRLFEGTPQVKLDFSRIFEWDSEGQGESEGESEGEGEEEVSYEAQKALAHQHHQQQQMRGSTSTSTMRTRQEKHGNGNANVFAVPVEVESDSDRGEDGDGDEDDVERTPKQSRVAPAPALSQRTRIRRPSARSASGSGARGGLLESAIHVPSTSTSTSAGARAKARMQSRPPSASGSGSGRPGSASSMRSRRENEKEKEREKQTEDAMNVEYDLSDEENLPSPFLKRTERQRITRTTSVPAHPHPHPHTTRTRERPPGAPRKSGNLRAMAVMNAAHATGTGGMVRAVTVSGGLNFGGGHGNGRGVTASASALGVRSSIAKAQRASEEARRALRPREVVA